MKEANLIHARTFRCIDNPQNFAIFLKYYAKHESVVNYGIIVPISFLEKIHSEQFQMNNDSKFNKLINFGNEAEKYSFNYGNMKQMTWTQLFNLMFKWVKKNIEPENSEFNSVIVGKNETMTLKELLSHSEEHKLENLKAA